MEQFDWEVFFNNNEVAVLCTSNEESTCSLSDGIYNDIHCAVNEYSTVIKW